MIRDIITSSNLKHVKKRNFSCSTWEEDNDFRAVFEKIYIIKLYICFLLRPLQRTKSGEYRLGFGFLNRSRGGVERESRYSLLSYTLLVPLVAA